MKKSSYLALDNLRISPSLRISQKWPWQPPTCGTMKWCPQNLLTGSSRYTFYRLQHNQQRQIPTRNKWIIVQDLIVAGSPTSTGAAPTGPKVFIFIPTSMPSMTSPHAEPSWNSPPHCTVGWYLLMITTKLSSPPSTGQSMELSRSLIREKFQKRLSTFKHVPILVAIPP